MRRFEYSQGTSDKFWEIEVEGCDVTVRYGRIGTQGQTKTKSHGSPSEAMAAGDKQIAGKTKKGYVEVGAVAAPPVHDAAPEPAVTPEPSPAKATPEPSPAKATPEPSAALPPEDDVVLPPDVPMLPTRARPGPAPEIPAKDADAFATLRFEIELTGWNPDLLPEDLAPLLTAALERLRSDDGGPRDPMVEGLVAYMLGLGGRTLSRRRALFHAWMAQRDLGFALLALFESFGFTAHHGVVIARRSTATIKRGTPMKGWKLGRTEIATGWERELLEHARTVALHAEPDVYAAALGTVTEAVATRPEILTVAAFVFPDSPLVDEALRAPGFRQLALMPLAKDAQDLERLTAQSATFDALPPTWLWTTLANVGPAAAPHLARELADAYDTRTLALALGGMPSDGAIAGLFARGDERDIASALATSCMRMPRRALRVLAPEAVGRGKPATRAKGLVSAVLRKYPGLSAHVASDLPEKAAALVERLDGEDETVLAEPEQLPEILRSPPWVAKKNAAKLPTLALEPLELAPRTAWSDGEHEAWAANRGWSGDAVDFAALGAGAVSKLEAELVALASADLNYDARLGRVGPFLADAPESSARAVLEAWSSRWNWHLEDWMPAIVARHGCAAEGMLRAQIAVTPRTAWPLLVPLGSTTLAPDVAQAFARKKSLRSIAAQWLDRHPEHAAVALIPAAFGKAKRARAVAEIALTHLGQGEARAVVLGVAQRYGEQARDALEALLAIDPLHRLPKKIPNLPGWFDPAVLTAPQLRGEQAALPRDAVRHLATMLAMSKPDEPYAGVEHVAAAVTPQSLSRFAWELFELWSTHGSDAKQSWAFTALTHIGGDEAARRLTPMLRAWPSEGAFARAKLGLDVLAGIGSDVALMHLHGIAEKVKSKALQKQAKERIEQIAEDMGLGPDELADRLVPDLGLDDDGSMQLDYGPRQFRVGFDESLAPFVLDGSGKRLKNLPKPGKKDDVAVAEPAAARWKALKKDARAVAKLQVARLERAMCLQRRWSADVWSNLFLQHPLLIHLVRRLVWGVFDGSTLVGSFRVAEDRTLADVEDEEFTLPADASIGIAHALELPAELGAAWGEQLSDYELLPPFPQLGRDVYRPEPGERDAKSLDRAKGKTVDTTAVLRLQTRGWARGVVEDAGISHRMELELADTVAVLELDPGIIAGMPDEFDEQTLGPVTVHRGRGGRWGYQDPKPLSVLSEVQFSELVRDLQAVLG